MEKSCRTAWALWYLGSRVSYAFVSLYIQTIFKEVALVMKKVIVLALGASIASCLALAINQSSLSAKAHIASYLVKQLHIPRDDVRGVLSYMTPKQNSMFDDSF